ncbi:hypothetical protein FA10DRAFT_135770 [Acaromyces ingoldii]|uniref:Uncharacterized protein n=1 Tax=Acaromyces ingoldii TaxID=215250 RepID=A0A316YI41_9BASI|nr:hypothetical protein FA10DRAFT_135770 [Acaromyces ingoldii]PWN89097.1 hypothetical protein FA10DRAFT_135770 [Acaromyces ingoldii]
MLSVSATQPSLSIAQGLLLTAWRLLLNGRARRASIMLGQCCAVVNALLDLSSQNSDGSIALTAATGAAAATAMVTVTEVRINGIDVAQLELELLGNIYWIEQSLLLWMSQSLNVGVPGYSSPTSPAALPPLDEHSSLVFELDYTSGHFTTLSNLARGIQQLRALAHVDCLAMSLDKRYRRCACKLADGSSVDRDAFKAVQELIPKIKDEVQNALPLSHASKHPYSVVKPAYLSFLLCASLVKSPVAEFDLTVGNANETRKTVLEVGEHLAKSVMEHGGDDEEGLRRRIVPLTASYFIEALSLLYSQQTAQEGEVATIRPTLAALWVFLKNDDTRAVKGKVQKVARRLQLDLSVAAAQMKIHQQLFAERGRCQQNAEPKLAPSNTSSRASVSEEEEDSEEDDSQEPGMEDPTAVQASFTFRKRNSGPTSAWSPFSSASSSSSSTTSCVAMPFASMRQTSLLPPPCFSLPTPVPARTTGFSDVNQQRHLRDTLLPSAAWASTPGRARSSIGSQPAHYLLHTKGNGTLQPHGVLQDFAEVLNRATLAPLSNKRKSPSMSDDEDEDALGGGDDEDDDEEEEGKARRRG